MSIIWPKNKVEPRYCIKIKTSHSCTRMWHQILSSTKKEDVKFKNAPTSCSRVMFHKPPPNHRQYTNPYGVHGLFRRYKLQFDPELGQGKFEIRSIPCACNKYTYKLGFPWNPVLSDDQHPRYQIPQYCVY